MVLNNQQWLISHKTKENKTKTNNILTKYLGDFGFVSIGNMLLNIKIEFEFHNFDIFDTFYMFNTNDFQTVTLFREFLSYKKNLHAVVLIHVFLSNMNE